MTAWVQPLSGRMTPASLAAGQAHQAAADERQLGLRRRVHPGLLKSKLQQAKALSGRRRPPQARYHLRPPLRPRLCGGGHCRISSRQDSGAAAQACACAPARLTLPRQTLVTSAWRAAWSRGGAPLTGTLPRLDRKQGRLVQPPACLLAGSNAGPAARSPVGQRARPGQGLPFCRRAFLACRRQTRVWRAPGEGLTLHEASLTGALCGRRKDPPLALGAGGGPQPSHEIGLASWG